MVTQRGQSLGRAEAGPGSGQGVLATIDADALLDGFSLAWARILTWLPLAGTLVLGAVYGISRPAYYWLAIEDHPLEWAQFGLLSFSCLTAGFAAVRFARVGRMWLAVLLVLVAIGCLGLAGEEISWGQRVFGLGVPGEWAAANTQRELTLHNMQVAGVSFDVATDVAQMIMGLGGTALALLARPGRSALRSGWLWEVAPPLVAVPGLALAVPYWVFKLGTGDGMAPVILFKEWVETCLHLCILLTVACCYTRATPGRYRSTRAGERVDRWLVPGVPVGRRPLVIAAIATAVLTAVFAVLTAQSHILPGNIPPSLVYLY